MSVTQPKISGDRKLNQYEKTLLFKYHVPITEAYATPHKPVEYIVGHVPFLHNTFVVSDAVLIPRVESEELVEWVAAACLETKQTQPLTILEVGTGSGAISIALGRELQRHNQLFQITATDVSLPALEVAKLNLDALFTPSPSQTISLLQSDLCLQLPQQTFDFVVANLPYVPTGRIAALDPSVSQYEPHLALDGGDDGFWLIAQFLAQLPAYTKPGTRIYLEIDHTHPSLLNTVAGKQYTVKTWQSKVSLCTFALLTTS